MAVTRIVPDITSSDVARSKEFYRLLGLEERMDLGWAVIIGPSDKPDVQLLLMERDESAAVNPDISIGVDDVDAAHEKMVIAGADIVHSLRDEPWGVRRFFVRDPNAKIVNVVQNL
jgi:predicted enzyme related to lactoylglutathione lyase